MSLPDTLYGQTALVTGASRGIGLAIAQRLGRMGARVAICARDAQRLEQAASAMRSEQIAVLPVPANVSRSEDVARLVSQVERTLGPIDILVNNAGIGFFGPGHEATEQKWDSVLDTNLKSVFLICRAVVPGMMKHGGGHIINISSLAGKNAFAGGAVYCASKWGLQGFSFCLAEDLRASNIRVSVVCPGSVLTEFSPHAGKDDSKMLQPEDVAHAVAALVTQAPQSFISEVLIRPTQKP
ncbi:MAG TPA: SDR family NAD(P)-dependent oxidoreductase [Methylomirabilota bacterium]|jgi:NAD(P)-dependent dehydrogenase (short-subunit alcohol dehydrogenase family)|nr:SDR family NAD(P)-dependent oxidoreductase [Methylomirabilota bacterium]